MDNTLARDFRVDNFKTILICLVVIVHYFSPGRGTLTQVYLSIDLIISFIMLFMMPSFTIISGFLTSGMTDKRRAQNFFTRIIFPYIVFEIIFFLVARKYNNTVLFAEPFYILWFLFCLIIWRMFMIAFGRYVKPQILLLFSFFLSFLCHSDMNAVEWMGRPVITYFPYFMFGYTFKEYIKNVKWSPFISLLLISIIFFIFSLFHVSREIICTHDYRITYEHIISIGTQNMAITWGPWYQSLSIDVGLKAMSVVLFLSCYSLISSKQNKLSYIGKEKTLILYLSHIWPMYGMILLGFYNENNPTYLLINGGIVLVVIWAFTSNVWNKIYTSIFEPRILFKLFQ